MAIEAQSVGGGGGDGGHAASGVTGAVSVGGFGAASRRWWCGYCNECADSRIMTSGSPPDAIFAQESLLRGGCG